MSDRLQKRYLSRRRRTPNFPIRIACLSHEGKGMVRWGNRDLIVGGALPGELVDVRITQKSSRAAQGIATVIHKSSPLRVSTPCVHADICGGCALQHIPRQDQVVHKRQVVDELMRKEGICFDQVTTLPALLGPTTEYRRRARLGVRWVHAKGRVLIGFRERASNFIADIDSCIVLDPRLSSYLYLVENVIGTLSSPNRIPQIEVVAGDDTLALVFRHLDPLTTSDQKLLMNLGIQTGWHIYLQPKGPASVHRIWPTTGLNYLSYRIGELGLEYHFKVTDFTQINAFVNRQMLIQAINLLDFRGSERVLDLFCGLGNFTLAVATRVREVVGVEVSEEMVERLAHNAANNGLTNISASAFDLTQSIDAQFWANEQWDTMIVDPPRSGAKEVLEALPMINTRRVLYVSCNPATFARDAKILIDRGFSMKYLGIVDMFPHTSHLESMALFTTD